jgi:hypothetical protein
MQATNKSRVLIEGILDQMEPDWESGLFPNMLNVVVDFIAASRLEDLDQIGYMNFEKNYLELVINANNLIDRKRQTLSSLEQLDLLGFIASCAIQKFKGGTVLADVSNLESIITKYLSRKNIPDELIDDLSRRISKEVRSSAFFVRQQIKGQDCLIFANASIYFYFRGLT